MAPGNNERHSSHTGTIPKTKVRNNSNVPQEVVTPTRRDMTSNLVTTSLDWVPVSEYNTRTNYNQSRKPTNNSSDHELTDLDNSVSFESGFGRFVPVRPQPRALPLNVQNRENLTSDHNDDGTGSSISGHTLHPYSHHMQNGLISHSNHAAAAVMIVNPTTPNAVAGNMSQPFNTPNQNRNNLTRNLNRNNFDGNSHSSNNNTPPISNSKTGTKAVNLMNNMYDQGQGSFNNLNENNHVHRESARALGEAIVAACPDAAAVERRLGQIREYIRVTSSLVDTMRNSEDEAFIEHTKEEYDELVEMVMKLKESEDKLEKMLTHQEPENIEVPTLDVTETTSQGEAIESKPEDISDTPCDSISQDKTCNINNDGKIIGNTLKKITNIENEQLNKSLNNVKPNFETVAQQDIIKASGTSTNETSYQSLPNHLEKTEGSEASSNTVEIKEIESIPCEEPETKKDDQHLNEMLRKNILSCVEKVALIEELKAKNKDISNNEIQQDVIVRPVSVQSNGSAYSENELWQNEIKSKMELSQLRLAALKQQQKRLLKYQEEAKQQLDEMNRERQSQEIQSSTSHDNFNGLQNPSFSGNYHHSNRMYAANQIGVATTLPHSSEALHGHQNISNNVDNDISAHSTHGQEDRFSHRDANIASSEEAAGARDSDADGDEEGLSERARLLQLKLRELHAKKQHMENLVSEFQKLQMATGVGSSHNTYSSSGEDSGDEETSRKCNKSGSNIKNEDPFKLMEINAIKTALQKTKDLMRSVENYEANMSNAHDDSFQLPSHSNLNDNKSDGGWSREGSVCRVRNALPPRHKLTNEHLHHHQQQQHQQQYQQQQQTHEANLASLQELAQELRMKTEKIMGDRPRGKDVLSNKGNVTEPSRKQKKVNEEVRASGSGEMGPAERRQMQLRALLADKQRELEALLNKEKIMCSSSENQAIKQESCGASIVVNQSYNSEQDEPESRSEQILLDSQNSRDNANFRGGGDSGMGGRSLNTIPSHLGSTYGSDSDSASRIKSNQRNRPRRRQPQDHQSEDNAGQSNSNQNRSHDSRIDVSNVNMVPPISQNSDSPINMAPPHLPPPCWNTTKSNQDMRTNQFTQNSHSQTMERLLGTPQMSFPPSMPFNMMMPFGMVGGCGCGCAVWGAWCWQQLAAHQRDIHQLRDQLNNLEERWRAETASHTLNNQVPPGNRANNYWDNFRSYSRQNLLSTSNKTNADGHLYTSPAHNPHPLVGRSHNALRRTTTPAAAAASAAKRNDEPPDRRSRRNLTCERSLSFSSAPDVLNVNQPGDADAGPAPALAADDAPAADPPDLHLDRLDLRNLNVADPIPEIIQSHSNNLNASANTKNKSSSKLPAKNSTNRRNYVAVPSRSGDDVGRPSASADPNLTPADRDVREKAASKLFDLLRENVYSEVTALIGANESHPDFLIQLFRELQLISTDPLRRRVLQSIRSVLSQYGPIVEDHSDETGRDTNVPEAVTTSTGETNEYREYDSFPVTNGCPSAIQIDDGIVRFLLLKSEEICTAELLEGLASHILSNVPDGRQTKKRLLEALSKYEGMRVCDVSTDIIDNLPLLISGSGEGDESTQHTSELSESSILQDVAGSLNLFSSSDTQLHQLNACPYDMWPGHVHMDIDDKHLNENNSPRSSREGKVDLIDCSEMHNGELAEADQSCHAEASESGGRGDAPAGADTLPDVVDTEEVTPTEAEAEWLGLDRVPTRLHLGESSEKQKD